MGGMGFIHTAECEIMHNSALINIHMIDAATQLGVRKYFFSSSACVYPDMKPGEPEMIEEEGKASRRDKEYGWEKLYAERTAKADGSRFNIQETCANEKTVSRRLGCTVSGRTRFINSPPTWVEWDLFIRLNAKSCTTAH